MSDGPVTLSRWKKIAFAALMTLLVGTLTEGALRIGFGPPPPPMLVYNTYDQGRGYFSESGGQVRATFVDVDPPPPFPASPSAPRCLVVGGSSVHGGSPDVASSGEFPALLEKKTGITTVNLGVPGHDSFDHRDMVKAALKWPWTCMVLFVGHNDFGNTYFQTRYGDLSGGLQARALAGMERLQLYVQLSRLVRARAGTESRRFGLPQNTDGFMTETRWWAALRYLRANTEQILWMAGRAGVSVVIVSPASSLLEAPAQGACSEADCATALYQQGLKQRRSDPRAAAALLKRARDADRVPLRAPGAAIDALHALADETGAIWVDAESGLPQESDLPVPSRRLFRDAVHFTAAGHTAMAELIAPALTEAVARQGQAKPAP